MRARVEKVDVLGWNKSEEHYVTPPPPQQPDRFGVDLCHEEGNRADGAHQLGAEFSGCEPGLWTCYLNGSAQGLHDVDAED